MTDQPTLAERRLTLPRVYDAPRELVWDAWTTPAHLERWFAPRPVTIKPGSVIVEHRQGGAFCLTMVMPDGTEFPNLGTFTAYERPERLAFGGTVENHPGLTSASTEVTFRDLGDDRTELTIEHVMVAVEDMPEMARLGWTQGLTQLGEVLAELG